MHAAAPGTPPPRPQQLRTARLSLRPADLAALGDLHALWTDPQVRPFLWSGHPLSLERSRDLLQHSVYAHEQDGTGLWVARDTEDRMVGFCGYLSDRGPHELELLYGVLPACWMRGYAREMAGALVAYGFEQLGLHEIRASTDAHNLGSVRVLKRLGFILDTAARRDDGRLRFRLPGSRRQAGGDWEAA